MQAFDAASSPALHHQRSKMNHQHLSITSTSIQQSSTTGSHLLLQRGGDDESANTEIQPTSRRGFILGFGALSLGLTTVLAKLGALPGPLLADSSDAVPYTDAFLLQDLGATILTAILGYGLAKGITLAFEKEFISSKDARKLVHTLSAPLFILFWPLFSPAQGSNFFCALVPLLNAMRLYLASTGQGESSLAMAVSRSGDLKEAAEGPFIYVCILCASIVLFWRDSAAGVVALCTMAVGDGLADLIGRRFGKSNPWPGLNKSVAGSVAFWAGSTFAIVGLMQWMQYFDYLTFVNAGGDPINLWIKAAGIGLATAALELVPIGDDNYNVPLAGALLGNFLFPL